MNELTHSVSHRPLVSDRIQSIAPSATMTIGAKARLLKQKGQKVWDLGVGEPDWPTPPHVIEAVNAFLKQGRITYTQADGLPELKAAIQERTRIDRGWHYDLSSIIVSCGAKHVIAQALQAVVNPGDEVAFFKPYWVSYPDMARLAGAVPVAIDMAYSQLNSSFDIDPDRCAATLNQKTRVLILNSPSNPTGCILSRDSLIFLADLLRQLPHILVITDDIYEKIHWYHDPCSNQNAKPELISPVPHLLDIAPDLKDRILRVDGVSKTYAMTGWRIGYGLGPQAWIKAMITIQSQSTSSPNHPAQIAAISALTGPQDYPAAMSADYQSRAHTLMSALRRIPGVQCPEASGAFYLFPSIAQWSMQLIHTACDIQFANHWIDTQGIVVMPGSPFGMPGHVRLSYAASTLAREYIVSKWLTLP